MRLSKPGPIIKASSWSHARRKSFDLADQGSDRDRGGRADRCWFAIEREINGLRERSALESVAASVMVSGLSNCSSRRGIGGSSAPTCS